MQYRVVEVGYKVVKIGRHVASCSLSALSCGGMAALSVPALSGMIALGSVSAVAADPSGLPDEIALSGGLAGDINGDLGTGYLISGDDRFGGSPTITIGQGDTQSLVHNFNTTGGAGSGGGAGLGGAFFVDKGATLTVINTDFKSNRVQGGTGGSEPALRFYDSTMNVTGQSVELPSMLISSTLEYSSLSYDAGAGTYAFDRVNVNPDATGMLYKNSQVYFSGYGQSARLDRVLSGSGVVELDAPVSIASGDVLRLTEAFDTVGGNVAISGTTISFNYAMHDSNLSDPDTGMEVDVPTGLSDLSIGSVVVAGMSDRTALQGAVVTGIDYYTAADDQTAGANGNLQGKIKSITLDKTLSSPGALSTFDVIKAPSFDASQYYITTVDDEQVINVTSSLGTYRTGMSVNWTDADGVDRTSIIASVSQDGRSFVLDTPLGDRVTGFDAVESPMVAGNQVRIEGASSLFSVDQTVFVPGEDGAAFTGTVTAIDGDVVTIVPASGSTGQLADFYDPAIGLAIKTATTTVADGGNAITVRFDTSSMSADKISALLNGRLVEGASFGEGTTITGVSVGNGTVTLSLSDAIDADATIEYFKLYSPLSTGGSMNNITLPGAQDDDASGGDGYSANWLSTFFNEGEGVDGTNGAPAGDATNGAGFNGGDGGNGSDGQPVNFWLMYDLASAVAGTVTATQGITLASLDLTAALNPDPVVGAAVGLPDPAEIAKASMGVSQASIDMTFAIADLALATVNVGYWAAQLGQGLAGLGGAGGDGGDASGGADFFGGGEGGAGGDGGDGAISISDGGDGGEGGQGGAGGFGAGGGQGGAGGAAGANGFAADGNPGDGGFAGFGAGEGANGDGLFGGGGDGLGGAIFVREGGTLLIQGNSLFELNYVAGGSTTSQFGEAGSSAGSDLFMMKGANVRLEPGLGNEIRFEGDIADDSLATNDGFMNAAGDGADLTIAGDGGLVVFNGENTYSGNTILQGATLTALMGEGVHDASLMRFNGAGISTVGGNGTLGLGTVGTFLLQEDYVRRAGTDPSETAWTGSGGFASGLEDGVVVTLGQLDAETGRGQALKWGYDGFFVPSSTTGAGVNGTLTFGSEQSVGSVKFTNNVNLNGYDGSGEGAIGRVAVYNTGAMDASTATLSGQWTNGGLLVGDAKAGTAYDGNLFMTGTNALSHLHLASGRLSTYAGLSGAGKLMASGSDLVVYDNSTLDTFGAETAGTATVLGGGAWNVAGSATTSGAVVNSGTITLLGSRVWSSTLFDQDFSLTSLLEQNGLDYTDEDFEDWDGTLSVGGNLTNTADAVFAQLGSVQVDGSVANTGLWVGAGAIGVGGNMVNTGSVTHDSGSDEAVTVAGDVGNAGGWVQRGSMRVDGTFVNTDSFALEGSLAVGEDLVNGVERDGEEVVSVGIFEQAGGVVVDGGIENDGFWRTADDVSIEARDLTGSGLFCLSASQQGTAATCDEGDAQTLDITLALDSTFDGAFVGAGNLNKSGDAVLILSQAQAFGGTLTVKEGGIVADSTMNDDLDIVLDTGATYLANVTDTVNSVHNMGTFTIAGGASFTTTGGFYNGSPNTVYMNADITTLTEDFDNSGRVVVNGERVLSAGGTDENAAGLTGDENGDFEIGTADQLTVIQNGDTTYAGKISDVSGDEEESGTFIKAGAGTLTLQGDVTVLDIVIAEGALALDGANIIHQSAVVDVRANAALELVAGDQSIDQLLGAGYVNLGGNDLDIRYGGAFSGTISGKGTVNVLEGDFNVSGTLTSSSEDSSFVVRDGATTTVGASGSLDVQTLEVIGDLYLAGQGTSHVSANTASVSGTLRGNGRIDASTTIIAGGHLSPGNSPGMLTFSDLTLDSGSNTLLEIVNTGDSAVAGTDYDRINISEGGMLTINSGATLDIADSAGASLGQTTHVMDFDTFAIQGYFGSVTTTAQNGGVLNLATGNVVSLGAQTLGQLEGLASNDNQRAMYSGLMVNDAGGVAQFYGGRFAEYLTQTWAQNGDVGSVFEKASPEVYAGFSGGAQSAALNAMPDWVSGFVGGAGTHGAFIDVSNSHFAANDNAGANMPFGVSATGSQVGLRMSGSDLSVVLSLGTATTRLEGDYLRADGDGMSWGATVVGALPGSENTVWFAGFQHAQLTFDGTRVSNGGMVDFSEVDSSATQFNIGLEYNRAVRNVDLGLRANLTFGSSDSDAFSEMAANGNMLDAMAVESVNADYARFDLGIKLSTEVREGTSFFGTLDVSVPLNDRNVAVAASYDNGQGAIGVNSVGLDKTSFAASVGVNQHISETGMLSVSVGAESAWDGGTDMRASLSARFDF